MSYFHPLFFIFCFLSPFSKDVSSIVWLIAAVIFRKREATSGFRIFPLLFPLGGLELGHGEHDQVHLVRL